jgi:hypothetical protein
VLGAVAELERSLIADRVRAAFPEYGNRLDSCVYDIPDRGATGLPSHGGMPR